MTGPGIPGLVSIIVPCYNRADIVGETIDSILAQTYGLFEAIIIDDGSTDNTRDVVAAYNDKRIRYIYQANGGLSSARNSGMDAARGEFIAFLDSDDVWFDWKLAAQLALLRRYPEAGLVWSDMSSFETGRNVLQERYIRTYYSAYSLVDFDAVHTPAGILSDLVTPPPEFARCPYHVADVFEHMFSGNLVLPSTAIVRRERLRQGGRFQPEVTGRGGEDYHFYFRLCSHGPVAFLDAPTTLYRVNGTSMTTLHNLQEARGNLRVITHWLERLPEGFPISVIQRTLANAHAWLGEEELIAGNSRTATHHLWKSLSFRKLQPSTAKLLLLALLPGRAVDMLRMAKRALLPTASDSSRPVGHHTV